MDKESLEIWELFQAGRYGPARKVILRELERSPESHWLKERLATSYYEQRQYAKALEIYREAYEMSPRCPLVVWSYAGALDAVGHRKEAVGLWRQLLSRGEERIAEDECGEGLPWARSLLNDARYRIGLSYWNMGKRSLAARYLEEHLRRRDRATRSVYPKRLVLRDLAAINRR